MREKNGFTIFLAVLGGASIVFSLISLGYHDEPLFIILTILGVVIVAFFPIRLPTEFYYAFDQIPAAYIMLKYDWTLAILPTTISLLALYLLTKNRKVNWFRYIVNTGLYSLTFLIGMNLFSFFSNHSHNFIVILLLIFLLDVISIILNRMLILSVLGPSALTVTKMEISYIAIFVVISSIILYRLYSAPSISELAIEIALTVLLFYIFKDVCTQYFKQAQLTSDVKLGYEMCIEASNEFFFELTTEGIVQMVNSVAIMELGLTNSEVEGLPFWKMMNSDLTEAQTSFDKARSGIPAGACIELIGTNGNTFRIKASFVPQTRNKTVTGIFMIGQIVELIPMM